MSRSSVGWPTRQAPAWLTLPSTAFGRSPGTAARARTTIQGGRDDTDHVDECDTRLELGLRTQAARVNEHGRVATHRRRQSDSAPSTRPDKTAGSRSRKCLSGYWNVMSCKVPSAFGWEWATDEGFFKRYGGLCEVVPAEGGGAWSARAATELWL